MTSPQHTDEHLRASITELTKTLLDNMDHLGFPITLANNRLLLAHLSQTLLQTARQRHQEAEASYAQWIAQEHLLSPQEVMIQLTITSKVLAKACEQGDVVPVSIPAAIQRHVAVLGYTHHAWFASSVTLTDTQRVALSEVELLSRKMAAERLHMSVPTFTRICEQYHVQPARSYVTGAGRIAHLYRLADIQQMQTMMDKG